jgi:osmoprotectant transport system substrate-binding protein
MASARTRLFGKLLGVVLLLTVLTLAGCGGGGSGGASGGPGKGIKVVVASKKDADGQLLAEMYALLLQNQGYNVTLRLGLGDNKVVDAAIKSGQIDIYPEFTGTALSNYGLPTTQDPQTAYTEVKNYYEQQLHITWLNAAFGLNDSYGICTSKANAQKYNLMTLDDLAKVSNKLTLAGQQDFTDPTTGVLPPAAKAYGLTFKKTVNISEQLSFDAVKNGNADLNECYTTDPAIVTDDFVLLTDDKNAFPSYNPAPLVRDAVLSQSSAIATTLNPLAAKLTTASQTALIKQVSVDGKPVKEVAQQFLQQQGMLPS